MLRKIMRVCKWKGRELGAMMTEAQVNHATTKAQNCSPAAYLPGSLTRRFTKMPILTRHCISGNKTGFSATN
jgi:hypothetical protein